jgi:hypothetical protein
MSGRFAGTLLSVGVICGLVDATAATAQPPQPASIPTFRLLHPSDVQGVSLSPNGAWIAALMPAPDGMGLIVLGRKNDSVVPMLANRLGNDRSFTGYRWLTNDDLLLRYTDYRHNVSQNVLVDVPRRSVHYLSSFTQLVKVPWGDGEHALISSSGNDCASAPSLAVVCLLSLDLAGGNTQPVSDGLPLLPLEFVALSSGDVYAKGRDSAGMQHEVQLLPATRAWKPVPEGTFERQRQIFRQQQAHPLSPDDAELNAAARAGIHHGERVLSQPSGHVVALIGRAPERSMVAVDSKLDGIEALLQGPLAGERVAMSGFNDQLTRGLLRVWDTDHPPRFLFLTETGLHEYAPLAVKLDAAKLGRTHIERGWVPGVAVSVTLPPEGVPLIGAVVIAFTSPESAGESALLEYSGDVQVLATRGIAVVRLLASLPAEFQDNAAGATWRAALKGAMQTVVTQVSQRVAPGHDVCLYGQGANGDLALAFGDLPHIGCVIAVNPMLDPHSALRTQIYDDGRQTLTVSLGEQALQTEVPAAFGGSDNGLMDPTGWAAAQPAHLMLAFNRSNLTGSNLATQSAAFRSAAGRAGKQVSFYAPAVTAQTPDAANVSLMDAVASYATGFFRAAPTSPLASR